MTTKVKTFFRNLSATNPIFGKVYATLANIKTNCKAQMSDEEYLRWKYKCAFNKELNLEDPTGYNEKLQWLKLHDRNPVYTKMVDKYEAKKLFTEKLGEGHVIPLLAVWNSVDEIDFDFLPKQFVLKCTHDSGGLIVCTDKSKLNIKNTKKYLQSRIKQSFYLRSREWAYRDIKPRIIAEEYVDALGHPDSIEYKVTCFNGKVEFITICQGKAHGTFYERTNDHYDVSFHHMPWYAYYKNAKIAPQKPAEWDDLIKISEILSENIPVLRVDCYIIDGRVYVGETTFYTWGGFIEFVPSEWNEILGAKIKLPKI